MAAGGADEWGAAQGDWSTADGSWNMTAESWIKGDASWCGQEGAWDTAQANWPIDCPNWGAPEAGLSATDPNWTTASADWGATEMSSTPDGNCCQCTACDSAWSRYQGIIKSYNSMSGYGFIMAEGLDRDVYLSKRELPIEMQQTRLEKGAEVTFELRVLEDGKPQACSVQFSSGRPQGTLHSQVALPGPAVVTDHSRLPHGVLLHGTVRSYSPRHGYGFLYLGAALKSQDLFFAKRDLPWDCQEQSLVGEPFSFEVTFGPNGKQQATTMLWLGCIPEGRALAESCMPYLEARNSGASVGNATRLPAIPTSFTPATTTPPPPPTLATTATGTTSNDFEHRFTGTVRSYSSPGGYGFIECPALAVDVWFAKHELPTDYQEQTINELRGCTVTFVLRSSKEGKRQARQIEVIMQAPYPQGDAASGIPVAMSATPPQPSAWNNSMPGNFATPIGGKSGRLLGNIKSFGNDYGYIASGQVNGDVSFHRSDLPSSLVDGVATLENGQQVLFRLEYAFDGSPQAKDLVLVPMAEERLFGTVKTYSVNSGYGFIEPMQGSPFVLDLYFHRNDVPEALQVYKLAGCQVSFLLKLTSDCKPQAKDILFLSSPSEVGEQDGEPTGQVLQGTIKTLKPSSGFGFLMCSELGADIWFARRELPSHFGTRGCEGTTVQFELWKVGDGKYQARNLQPAESGACKRPLDGSFEANEMPPAKRLASDQEVPQEPGVAGVAGMAGMAADVSIPSQVPAVATADMSAVQTGQPLSVPPPPPPPAA